jgi:hypothetical protein
MVVSMEARQEIFYHKRQKQPDPFEHWLGKGAEGNKKDAEEARAEKEKAASGYPADERGDD